MVHENASPPLSPAASIAANTIRQSFSCTFYASTRCLPGILSANIQSSRPEPFTSWP